MISPKIAASTALTILLASSSPGEDSQEELLHFTLPQAVEVALALNPEVLGEREKTEEFSSLVSEARAKELPELNVALGYRQNRDPGLRNSPFFARLLEGPDPIPAEALDAFFFTNYIWGVAVIFGLTVATVLTLVVVPVTYHSLDSLSAALARLPEKRGAKERSGAVAESAV